MNKERTNAVIRLIVMVVLTANMALTVAGKNPLPLDEAALTEWLTVAAAGIASIYAWWKNNNITRAAIEGQEVKNAMKQQDREVIEEYADVEEEQEE